MCVQYEVPVTVDMATYQITENYRNDCHLKNIGQKNLISDVLIDKPQLYLRKTASLLNGNGKLVLPESICSLMP